MLKPWIIFKGKVQKKSWFDVLEEGHITVSDDGWTNNEIGVTWLEDCFEQETASIKKGEYHMLCLDGHSSHVSIAAMNFCIKKKIILLCLPRHTTDVLQPLDIGLFSPLAVRYKNNIQKASRLGAGYHIDKEDFIKHYQSARKEAFTKTSIKRAWKKAALSPFDPQLILKDYQPTEAPPNQQERQFHITIRPNTPPEGVISVSNATGQSTNELALTPANSAEVQALMREFEKVSLDEEKKVIFQKVAKRFMADCTLHASTNEELVEHSKDEQRKKGRTKGNYGKARHLSAEIRGQRIQELKEKEAAKEAADEEKERKQKAKDSKKIAAQEEKARKKEREDAAERKREEKKLEQERKAAERAEKQLQKRLTPRTPRLPGKRSHLLLLPLQQLHQDHRDSHPNSRNPTRRSRPRSSSSSAFLKRWNHQNLGLERN